MQRKKIIMVLVLPLILVLLTGCGKKLAKIDKLEDLENKKIGVATGSEYDRLLSERIPSAKPAYYNTYSDQISSLKSGKIDAFLTDEPLAKEILKSNKSLKTLDVKLTEDSYAFAINPNKSKLKKEIDNIILEMKEDGTLDKFEEKWMGYDEDKKELDSYKTSGKNGKIKFATVSGSAPFAYMKNNQLVGYDIEVISYIAQKLDYKLEIVEMSFEGIIPALKSGKVDVSGCSIIVTEERKKSVLFSEPDYTGGIVVVVRD